MANSLKKSYASLTVAAVCFGSIAVFSYYLTQLGVSSLQQAFFRTSFTVLYLFIGLGVVYSFRNITIQRKHLIHFIVYGLIGIALGLIVYITSIAIGTPVVVAVSLTYLYPAITLILGRLFLQEPFTRIRLIAVPLSIAGAVIVSLPIFPYVVAVPLAGIFLALSNAVFAAIYMVLGRKWSGHEGYRPSVTTFWGYFFAMLWMVPIYLIASLFVSDPRVVGFQLLLPLHAWLLLLGFGLIATAIPYMLTNVGVEKVDASAASIILLLDPISATFFGFIFLGQPVAFWQAIGAALIFLATILIALEPRFRDDKTTTNHSEADSA
ncbi:MAG: DMT family transporter [Candidatus Hermodarchaeia archaeon]|jgi:drug/metabolite transporter (DMT)-like permease